MKTDKLNNEEGRWEQVMQDSEKRILILNQLKSFRIIGFFQKRHTNVVTTRQYVNMKFIGNINLVGYKIKEMS